MSDLFTSLDRLEVEFSEACEAHDDGGNLTFLLVPIDEAVEIGPTRIETVHIPKGYLPGTTWCEPFGFALWTDFMGCPHQILAFVAGTPRSAEPRQAFLRLARRAGAISFRFPRGRAQTGPGNAPELNWLGTLYSYLKGTPFVVEGPGHSRLRSVFAASIEVLSHIHRGDSSGNASPYTGSLRPGIPGVQGEARFDLSPSDGSPCEEVPTEGAGTTPVPQPTASTAGTDPASSQPNNPTCGNGPARDEHQASLQLLLSVFTNGLADERIERAARLLRDDNLTANEKLTGIDALIPFPATASAEQLGGMLGVTKQAVLKTGWWIQNRKGEKDDEIGRRRVGHQKRAKEYETPGTPEADGN